MNARRVEGERGSIVLFVLFVCLSIAVLVQTLAAVVICENRGRDAEARGRRLMSDKDLALSGVRQNLLLAWAPRERSTSSGGSQDVQTAVTDVPDSADWVLAAAATHAADVSSITVSAWVERGRDGVDLPFAGLVAESATWCAGRASPWLEREGAGAAGPDDGGGAGVPLGWLRAVPPTALLGPGVALGNLSSPWRMDEGWRRLFEAQAGAGSAQDGLAPGSDACVLGGRRGTAVRLPSAWGATAGEPALIIVTGGASLDATERGDLHGVIVIDDGSVSLEGTRIHGAVFATGTVDFGTRGEVLFSPQVFRWATDRSLVRTRLVPGSRRESLQ